MEEVTFSDFIVHVVDVSHPNWEIQHGAVMDTLQSLGAGEKPILTAFNKIDLVVDPFARRNLAAEWPNSVTISAAKGEGIDDLLHAIVRMVKSLLSPIRALVPYDHSGLVQECYDYGRVLSVEYKDDGILVFAELVSEMYEKLKRYETPG